MIALATSIFTITMRAGTSLIYATVGEIFTERSGILNLGLEGIMLMGAVSAFDTSYYTESLLAAVVAAMAVGIVLSSIHAFLSITMHANQVVSGLCITIFGGINAVQFRLQAAGTTIPAAFLNMLPYLATIVVLVVVTWWENLSKRIGAPAALCKPYIREEK